MSVLVKVVVPHQHVGVIPDYHEWVGTGERVRADKNGKRNPRMYSANWTTWICNNSDCFAFAFVADDAIRELLAEAEESS